MVDDKIS